MKLAEIKLLLINKVSESNHSQSDKNKLYEFIGDANEIQTKQLLLFGTMQESINEQQEAIINEMFESDEVQQKLQEGVVKTVLGMWLMTPAGWALWRLINSTFSKNKRKCGTFAIGKARDLCLLRAKMTKYSKLINLAKKEMGNCGQLKKPEKVEKCKQKASTKIGQWQEEIKELQERIKDLRGGERPQSQSPSLNVNVNRSGS